MMHVRVAHASILGTCLLCSLVASLAHGQSARPSGRAVVTIAGPAGRRSRRPWPRGLATDA